MTLHRVIWADSSNAVIARSHVSIGNRVSLFNKCFKDCRLTLHHSLVKHIDRHHKTIFSRAGKVGLFSFNSMERMCRHRNEKILDFCLSRTASF